MTRKPRLYFDDALTATGAPGQPPADLLAEYAGWMRADGREVRVESDSTGWIDCHSTCADLPRTEADRPADPAARFWPLHPEPVGAGHRLSVR